MERTEILSVAGAAHLLAPLGLNLIGGVSVQSYDAGLDPARSLSGLAPTARSVLVIGNGGGAFWSTYVARQTRAATGPNPLDDYTRTTVTAALTGWLPVGGQLLFPFDYPAVPVSFQRLALLAGLGGPSLLGVLVHPEFGPWIALRAAVLLPGVVTAPRPADGFDPCPTCIDRACMPSCPTGAITEAGWDVPRCAAYRSRVDDPCGSRCHARFDCVIGRAHRYPAAASVHHQAAVRPGLLAVGGITGS